MSSSSSVDELHQVLFSWCYLASSFILYLIADDFLVADLYYKLYVIIHLRASMLCVCKLANYLYQMSCDDKHYTSSIYEDEMIWMLFTAVTVYYK